MIFFLITFCFLFFKESLFSKFKRDPEVVLHNYLLNSDFDHFSSPEKILKEKPDRENCFLEEATLKKTELFEKKIEEEKKIEKKESSEEINLSKELIPNKIMEEKLKKMEEKLEKKEPLRKNKRASRRKTRSNK